MKKSLREWCIENNRCDLLEQWDYEKNSELTPDDISSQSHKMAYWKCPVCHFSLPCRIQDKVLGKTKCRVCSNKVVVPGYNDFKTWCKQNGKEYLLGEWDYHKNKGLVNGNGDDISTPDKVSPFSTKKNWWKCCHGHEWQTEINVRAKGSMCPYCTGRRLAKGINDLETWCRKNHKEFILDEWDYEKNDVFPSEITAHNDKIVWFKCPSGHNYSCVLNSRTNIDGRHGCPECNKSNITSFPEQAILFYLKKIYPDAEGSNRTVLDGKELDIYIPSINTAIEYDGERYHNNTKKDEKKNKMCAELGITLYRIREPLCPILTDKSSINIQLLKRNNVKELERVIFCLFQNLQIDNLTIDINKDECEIRKIYIKSRIDDSFKSYCKNNNRQDLLDEWHTTKNEDLKPENFSYGSRSKVWWKCSVCNHEWQAIINNRVRMQYGCPECGKKRTAKKTSKKIKCVETGEVFHSLRSASDSKHVNIGHMSECCNGKRKTAGGFHWVYID